METNKNKLWILLGVILVVVIIIIVAATQGRKSAGPSGQPSGQTPTGDAPDAAVEVDREDLMPAPTTNEDGQEVAALEGAVVVAPGANPITQDNKVVTAEGEQTDNAAQPMSDTAPRQTGFLDKEALPETLINITVAKTFTPNRFTTRAGAPTSFSLTGGDDYSHVIAFDDPAMSAIAILVGPGQTKAITFNAPTTPGTYTFRDAAPDKTATGEMIVQ